jgi:hypothetical protein
VCDSCLPAYQAEQFRQFDGSGWQHWRSPRPRDWTVPHPRRRRSQETRRLDRQRKAEVAAWEARYGKLVDLSAFGREILPLIQEVPLSRLVKASGRSLLYCSQIRRGEKTPDPRPLATDLRSHRTFDDTPCRSWRIFGFLRCRADRPSKPLPVGYEGAV